jgi:hypothetical protein
LYSAASDRSSCAPSGSEGRGMLHLGRLRGVRARVRVRVRVGVGVGVRMGQG